MMIGNPDKTRELKWNVKAEKGEVHKPGQTWAIL